MISQIFIYYKSILLEIDYLESATTLILFVTFSTKPNDSPCIFLSEKSVPA